MPEHFTHLGTALSKSPHLIPFYFTKQGEAIGWGNEEHVHNSLTKLRENAMVSVNITGEIGDIIISASLNNLNSSDLQHEELMKVYDDNLSFHPFNSLEIYWQRYFFSILDNNPLGEDAMREIIRISTRLIFKDQGSQDLVMEAIRTHAVMTLLRQLGSETNIKELLTQEEHFREKVYRDMEKGSKRREKDPILDLLG